MHSELMAGRHFLAARALGRPFNVMVVGAGGTGSHMIADLAVLHQTMLDMGGRYGLDLTVLDDDEVAEANIGRARYFSADIGANKALVLVNRINACLGSGFKAEARKFDDKVSLKGVDLVVGCVDTRQSRRAIWQAGVSGNGGGYWLDLGNGEYDGQCILGQFPTERQVMARCRRTDEDKRRLPCVVELFPQMLDPALDPEDSGPSCSRMEALTKQSAFVNKAAALHGVSMLSALLLTGQIAHHGVFFNLLTGRSGTLACDAGAWARFGYGAKRRPARKASAATAQAAQAALPNGAGVTEREEAMA